MVVGEGLLGALRLALRVVACGNAFSLRSNRTLVEASHPSRMGWIWGTERSVNSIRHRSDGGGGRIRTFEVDDGRFTVCSLWPLGNPTRGKIKLWAIQQNEWWWGKDNSSLSLLALRAVACGNVLSLALESNLSRRFLPFPLSANIVYACRGNHITVVNNGGGGRIRTFEVDDGRFTVCSLWPLGNPTTG